MPSPDSSRPQRDEANAPASRQPGREERTFRASPPRQNRSDTREHPPRSERDLARYGYAGQGYPIYGEPRQPQAEPEPEADPLRASAERHPAAFGAGSGAYALGYTTSMLGRDAERGGHAGKGPKGYVRSAARIREDVCDRLADDDEVDASDISVSVTEGDILLEGTVADRRSKRRAEMLAISVRGVSDVHNRLRVRRDH